MVGGFIRTQTNVIKPRDILGFHSDEWGATVASQ